MSLKEAKHCFLFFFQNDISNMSKSLLEHTLHQLNISVLIPVHLLFAEAVHILLQLAYLNVYLNSESHFVHSGDFECNEAMAISIKFASNEYSW